MAFSKLKFTDGHHTRESPTKLLLMKPLLILVGLLFLHFGCSTNKDTETAVTSGKFMEVNGKLLYYEQFGKGIPLLLLCGGGINRSIEDFKLCIPDLSNHFNVIAVDSPGQGKSESPDTLSYQILKETMSKFIDSLHVDSLYVMGFSDGGVAAIMLAAENEKIKKVIAVGPNNGKVGFNVPPEFPVESLGPPPAEYFERENKEIIKKYMETPGRDWRKMTAELGAMWYADEYFPKSTYGKITVPLMIVLGDRDDISVQHGVEMTQAIVHSQLCVLPNTSHDVFKERPTWITQIAIDFFQSRPKTSDNLN
jgi:pimeloyl-ACP methyl ester carboxylesterase